MKRLFLLLAITVLVLQGATGAMAAPARPRVKLTYWCSPYPNEAGWAIMMTRLWNQTHPDVQVKLQAIPQGRVAEDVLREAMRSKNGPDVCSHLFPANVTEFVRLGGLASLEAFPALVTAAEKRSGRASVQSFRSPDGHLYQVPWKCNPIMIQYNRGLLSKMGLKPPRTYSEFLAAGEVLRKKAGVYAWAPSTADRWWDRYYDWYPLYLAASRGQGVIDAGGRPAFKNAAAVAALEFIGRTFRKGYAPTTPAYDSNNARNEAFAAGKIAFLVTGPWNVQAMQELAGNTVDFGYCPLPVPDGPPSPVYTYGNFRNIGIFSSCKHPAEAARFVEFLISRQADVAFLEQCSEIPYRPALLDDPSFGPPLRKNVQLMAFVRQIANVRSVGGAATFNKVLGTVSRQFVESAVRGSKSAQQAIHDAFDEASRLVSGGP